MMNYEFPSDRVQVQDIKVIPVFRINPADQDMKGLVLRFTIPTNFSERLLNEFGGVILYLATIDSISELFIILRNPDVEDTFDVFCEDILDALRNSYNQNSALNDVNKKLESWKLLFSKIANTRLSLEKQKGLFGELVFLNQILSDEENEEEIVRSWTGPDMERRDFLLNNVGVEIKTSSANFPVLKISNETQLEINNLRNLYLILYSIETRNGNVETLNRLVNEIKEKLKKPLSRELFVLKLSRYGYVMEDQEYYEGKEFIIRQIFPYHVNAEFPKLTTQNIPSGIFDSSYRIELSGLNQFVIDEITIINDLMDNES